MVGIARPTSGMGALLTLAPLTMAPLTMAILTMAPITMAILAMGGREPYAGRRATTYYGSTYYGYLLWTLRW